jgi:hypothetical protein
MFVLLGSGFILLLIVATHRVQRWIVSMSAVSVLLSVHQTVLTNGR